MIYQIDLPWHRKPSPQEARIDWADPLSQGLVGCWLFNERGGSGALNLVTQRRHSTNAMVWGPQGVSGWTSDGNRYMSARMPACAAYTLFSIQSTPNFDSIQDVVDQDDGGTRQFQFRIETSGQLNFIPFTTGTNGSTPSAIAAPLNTYFSMAATADGKTRAVCYLNGVGTVVTGLTGTLLGISSAIDVYIGKRAANNLMFAGTIKTTMIWNRALSASEILQLHELTKNW